MLMSCRESNVPESKTQYKISSSYKTLEVPESKTQYKISSSCKTLELVILDSCEYFFREWGSATILTHKGNCKNHKLNKQD